MLLIITGLAVEICADQEMTNLAITLVKKMVKNSANLAGLEITVKKVFIAHYLTNAYIVMCGDIIQSVQVLIIQKAQEAQASPLKFKRGLKMNEKGPPILIFSFYIAFLKFLEKACLKV